MISIVAYRVAIGIFLSKARILSQPGSPHRCGRNTVVQAKSPSNIHFLSLLLVFIVTILLYVNFILLLMAGNVSIGLTKLTGNTRCSHVTLPDCLSPPCFQILQWGFPFPSILLNDPFTGYITQLIMVIRQIYLSSFKGAASILIISFNAAKLLLLLSGDIETNPGPVLGLTKVVKGSFPQSGHQCTYNAFIAICWSAIKNVSYWDTKDLDYILEEGAELYSLAGNTLEFISVADVPEVLMLENEPVVANKLSLETWEMNLDRNTPFLHQSYVEKEQNVGNGLLFVTGAYTTALIWPNSRDTDSIYLFDSHNRDSEGQFTDNGTSVLLRFLSLLDVEQYIKKLYLTTSRSAYCQGQFLRIIIDDNVASKIKASARRRRLRLIASERRLTVSGTHTHDIYKLKLRERYSSISCTPEYEKLKEKMRKTSMDNFNSIVGTPAHERLKENMRKRHFSILGSPEHKKQKLRKKELFQKNRNSKTPEERIEAFREKTKEGPFYVCIICNRSLYKRSVIIFDSRKYNMNFEDIVPERVQSFDQKEYVCLTCHKKLLKQKIPCQAVCNNLMAYDFPDEIPKLRTLEKIIIAKRILYKKFAPVVKGKGAFPKIRGNICNVPIDSEDICNVLPRGLDNNGIVLVQLKKKLNLKSAVYFLPVRRNVVRQALDYLKQNNPFYGDIEINTAGIENQAFNLENLNSDSNFQTDVFETSTLTNIETSEDNLEEQENPLDEFRLGSSETSFVANIPCQKIDNGNIIIAPGEDKTPIPLFKDLNCEELAHPNLFPTGKFGYNCAEKREVDLTATKYFNQRLLNYKQKFASDSDYIFFVHSVTQHIKLNEKITIAMKKVKNSNSLTAGMLSSNFKETVKKFIANDEAFNFMNTLKGTPAYWKKFLLEILAMIKQLSIPTFFLTLSCADLRWNELISIITKLMCKPMSEEEINKLSSHERADILNNNPVLLARHFQYRVETFFKDIISDGPLGKVKYHAIRVEFQVRGSPHIHSFLWVPDSPVLSPESKEEYIAFMDSVIKCELPEKESQPELYEKVMTYQMHTHSKSCRKYKNKKCRYSYGRYFTDHTIVAEPLPANMSPEVKNDKLNHRKKILSKVKTYIDENLCPKYKNLYDPDKPNYQPPKSITEILEELDIPEEDYYNALSMSPEDGCQIHFKRATNACFVNNYFAEGLMAWDANIDIQPVLDHYKAVSYMCAYISKSEDESTEAMKQAAREAFEMNKGAREQMNAIANAYKTKRQLSVQEAVYHILPELWLRRTKPLVQFANSNLPEKRYKFLNTEEEILSMDSENKNIYKRSMIDRYIERPDLTFKNGKYSILDSFCFANFLANYAVDYKADPDEQNDSQPEILDELLDSVEYENSYPNVIPLMGCKERLKLRKEKSVLRYHVPNPNKDAESYAHHLLCMFYPFRNESNLKINGSYQTKLQDPGVLDIINRNKEIFEPFADKVEEAMLRFHRNSHNMDPQGEQENDDIQEELNQQSISDSEDENEDSPATNDLSGNAPVLTTTIPDEELHERIRTLNDKQREVYEVVNKWARDYVKLLSSNSNSVGVKPLHMFLTGSGGCGKSHLIKTIYQSLTKTFSYRDSESQKEKVLLLAPTGVAAINIGGTTIHSGLGIPPSSYGKTVPKLSDQKRGMLGNKLSEVCAIIIDEISMVSNYLLLYIHQRLTEIFGVSTDIPFAGKSIIACGDFYQLPPISQRPVYAEFRDPLLNLSHCWGHFKLAELTEVMRQRGDSRFIDLLNNVRINDLSSDDEALLQSRFVNEGIRNYPHEAIHIWPENIPVSTHNENMMSLLTTKEYKIEAIDKIPQQISASDIIKINKRSQMDTAGLALNLKVKEGARVMLTANIDTLDTLANGLIGTVYKIAENSRNEVNKIYVKFDNREAGKKKMNSDRFARETHTVGIEKVEGNIKVNPRNPNSYVIKRVQFPLMLAWACTVHKVQGNQFEKLVVSFELNKQRSFNKGQMYVALSRSITLDGLYLRGIYDRNAIKCDDKATEQLQAMRDHCPMPPVKRLQSPCNDTMVITLLNTRSLLKHAKDISADKILMDSDVIALTETQFLQNTNEERRKEVKDVLSPFHLISYDDHVDRYISRAFCYRDPVKLLNYHDTPCASYFKVIKSSLLDHPINFLLLYRKHSFSQQNLCNLLQIFLERDAWFAEEVLHIIMGDFNINAFDENPLLSNTLQNYELEVTEPTHISGSLIDHVYVHKQFKREFSIDSVVKNIYFSDHDAVQFQLNKKR